MNHLLHRVHSAALATLMLGLLCIHFPARAAQADDATFEKRVAAVESALAELEEISSKYLAGEAELALHLAAVKREDAKIQRNYAEYKALIHSWAYIGTLDPKGTKSKLNQTQKQTKKLRSALAAWSQQVQQARQYQDDICANKARIDSGSPQQIAQWEESGSKLLLTHTTQLREKRKVLTSAWNGLNSVSSELGIQLGHMEGFLAKKEEYMTSFSRMKALADTSKVTCRGLEKDLAKAKELQNELKELMKEALTYRRILLPELERLQKQVTIETDFLSNTDRADLKARIDSALARLESTTLSRPLPAVPELNSQCETFIDGSNQLDSAKMKVNLQHSESIAADARSVLSKARDALKEASSAQAGFDGLGKARDCLAALRRAQADAEKTDVDEVLSLVEGLQTRMEKAERQEHIFTSRNRENLASSEEMKRLARNAVDIYKNWLQSYEELGNRLGPLKPDQAMQNLDQLLSSLYEQTEKLEKAAKAMSQSIQDAKQEQQTICERAAKTDSMPPPSNAELQTWHGDSGSGLDRVRQALEVASRKVEVHVGLVAAQAKEVTASREKLSEIKGKLLIWLKFTADCHNQVTDAQDLLKKASDIWEQVTREGKALESLRKANLEELKRIQTAASELAPRLINESTIAELKAIEARAAGLASQYPQSAEMGMINQRDELSSILPINNKKQDHWLQELSESLTTLERQLSKIKELIKKAGTALEQAESVREASARERTSYAGILTEIEKCVHTLATAISPVGDPVAKARQALQECNYDQAQGLIDKLSQGPDKTALAQELSDGKALQNTLVSFVNEAQKHYYECRYDQANAVLKKAEQKAQCQKHKDSIADKLNKVKALQELETELRSMVDKANTLYQECRFNKVMPILNEALAKAKCKKHKKSLNDKIKLAEKRRQHEKTTLALFEAANKLYRKDKYEKALAKLQQAKEHTSCQRFRDSLENKIAMVQGKIESGEFEGQKQKNTCTGFVDQLTAQAEEVRRLAEHFDGIRRDNPGSPLEVTGPNACRAMAASELFQAIWRQARDANCMEATRIQNPMGIGAASIQITCSRWKATGDSIEIIEKRSCSIKIHDDLQGKQTDAGMIWTMASEESGKSKTVHIARVGGPWWKGYRTRHHLGFMASLTPICGGSGTTGIRGGHRCTLAEMKAMANEACAKWKQGP